MRVDRPYLSAMLALIVLILLLGTLSACSSIEKPRDAKDGLAYAEATLTGAYVSIADLKKSGRISADRRDYLVGAADSVGATLDAARAAAGLGDLHTASEKLRLAQNGLRVLLTALKEAK